MSRESVPGHDISYHLVCFDETGNERGRESADVVYDAPGGVTDVFFFNHGWNGDVPAARQQYGQWVATMAGCRAEREAAHRLPGGFKSLLVGLHWPSKAWGDEDNAIVQVSDNGRGIAKKDQARVFNRFDRIGDQPSRGEAALGLGLPLTRQFIEAHGGKVELVSAKGKGTTVTMTVPRAPK